MSRQQAIDLLRSQGAVRIDDPGAPYVIRAAKPSESWPGLTAFATASCVYGADNYIVSPWLVGGV